MVDTVKNRVKHGFADLAAAGRAVPKAGLAFRLEATPGLGRPPAPAWLATVGRLALTATFAAIAIWLALTHGGPR